MFHDIPIHERTSKTWRDFLAPGLGVVGGAIGAVYGGPAGAVAGYGLGQTAGGLLNSASDQGTIDTNAGIKNSLAGWQGLQQADQDQQRLAMARANAMKGDAQLVMPTAAPQTQMSPSQLPPMMQPNIGNYNPKTGMSW